jgi:hypothetical protein
MTESTSTGIGPCQWREVALGQARARAHPQRGATWVEAAWWDQTMSSNGSMPRGPAAVGENGGGGSWGWRAMPMMEDNEAEVMAVLGLGQVVVQWQEQAPTASSVAVHGEHLRQQDKERDGERVSERGQGRALRPLFSQTRVWGGTQQAHQRAMWCEMPEIGWPRPAPKGVHIGRRNDWARLLLLPFYPKPNNKSSNQQGKDVELHEVNNVLKGFWASLAWFARCEVPKWGTWN